MANLLINIGYVLLMIICFYLAWYLSLIIHEVAHMIVAIANGQRFLAIYAGPIKIYKAKEGIKYSFFKGRGASCVTSLPLDIVRDSNKLNSISKRVVLAGPISSLVLVILMYTVIFIYFNDSSFLPLILVPTLAPLLFCIYSFKIGFDGGWSDIAAYLMLKKQSTKETMEACLRVQYSVLLVDSFDELEEGLSIKNIDLNDIDILLNSNDVRFKYFALRHAYEYYKVVENMDKAEEMRGNQLLLDDKINENARATLKIQV